MKENFCIRRVSRRRFWMSHMADGASQTGGGAVGIASLRRSVTRPAPPGERCDLELHFTSRSTSSYEKLSASLQPRLTFCSRPCHPVPTGASLTKTGRRPVTVAGGGGRSLRPERGRGPRKVRAMNGTRLSDIAAQAGVSEATVSRVLNGRPGVSAATRQAVLTALDLMGYERPQRLRQRSNGLVGLVTPELDNPIFPAFAQAAEKALIQHGYTPVLCTQLPGGVPEDEFIELLVERGVSGIVFVSGLHADTTARVDRYTRLTERGLPIVLVDGYASDIGAPFISPDDRTAARLAVQHLVDLGHERIGLAVGPRRFVPVIRKIEGYRQAMAQLLGVTEVEELISHSLFS